MSHLLTMSELSEVEISEILKRRRRFCEWERKQNDRANFCCELVL